MIFRRTETAQSPHSRSSHPSRGAVRWLSAAICLVLALAATPEVSSAHQRLLRMEPARDAELARAPDRLRLVFNEPVELAFTRVELLDAAGRPVPLGEAHSERDSAAVLIVPIREALTSGRYTVRWSTASRDGHPVRGQFAFTVAVGAAAARDQPPGEAAGAAAAPGSPAPPAAHHPAPGAGALDGFGAESPIFVGIRWITYLALAGVVGAVSFAILVLGVARRRGGMAGTELLVPARRRAAGAGLLFAGLLGLAALARLPAQSLAMHGPAGALEPELIRSLLTRTVWGWGWLLQLAGTLVAALGFALARAGSGSGWLLAALAALALALSPALSGHAAAMPGTLGTAAIAADTVHVLAMGAWLGGLLVLLLAGVPAAVGLGTARRGPALAALVGAFSPVALLSVVLLLATGVFSAALHVGSLRVLLESDYGRLLLLKLAGVALVLLAGAYNFLRMRPRLGTDSVTPRFRRSARLELVLGALVLLVTAVLVATARP